MLESPRVRRLINIAGRWQLLSRLAARAAGHAEDAGAGSHRRAHGLSALGAAAGRLMLDRTGRPTPRLRASVLREELEGRLQRLQELEHWIKESAGADNRERVRADAVAVAIDQIGRAHV